MSDSNCEIETVGHHVCKNTGEKDVLGKAPFPSTREDKFLGDGYYFWEDNEQLAKAWGGKTYHKKGIPYCVCQFALTFDREQFYDLIGSREHQKHLVGVRKFLTQRRQALHGWPIGKVIDFLREANSSDDPEYEVFKGEFEYTVIRAADDSDTAVQDLLKFAKDQPNVADLNPCYIICVIDIKKVVLGPIKVVHASKTN